MTMQLMSKAIKDHNICVPIIHGLPDDVEVVSVHHDYMRKAFSFTVRSSSFSISPDGAEIPLLEGFHPIFYEWAKYVGEPLGGVDPALPGSDRTVVELRDRFGFSIPAKLAIDPNACNYAAASAESDEPIRISKD